MKKYGKKITNNITFGINGSCLLVYCGVIISKIDLLQLILLC